MNVQKVKSAQGCRVRNPKTGNLVPNVADDGADGMLVDLDDPYWFRCMAAKDIVAVKADAAISAPAVADPAASPPVASSASAPTTTGTTSPAPAATTAPATKSA